MSHLSDDVNIQAVLQRAAGDAAFRRLLLDNRQAALAAFPLTAAERELLLAATAAQIETMVRQARALKWYQRPVSRRRAALAAATGVLALGGTVLVIGTTHSAGVRPDRIGYQRLETIAEAQAIYHEQHGRYGSLEELTGGNRPVLHPHVLTEQKLFVFEVELTGDSFTAIARQKNTQRAWKTGPDGKIVPLE